MRDEQDSKHQVRHLEETFETYFDEKFPKEFSLKDNRSQGSISYINQELLTPKCENSIKQLKTD